MRKITSFYNGFSMMRDYKIEDLIAEVRPCIGEFDDRGLSNPHYTPSLAREGVVGHNIDRCISRLHACAKARACV